MSPQPFERSVRCTLLAFTALAVAAPIASATPYVTEDWYGAAGSGWQQGPATDFLGWTTTSSDSTFTGWLADQSGRRSLAVEAQFLPQQGPGTGEWRFRAPGTSTITKAEYGAAYFTKEGCLNEGMRLAGGGWQPTRNVRVGDAGGAASVHPTACGANATVTGAPVTTKDGATAVTITGAPGRQTFCSTTGCGLSGSPVGNQAVFGAERIKQGRPGFGVVLPGARLTLTDYDAPKLTSATNSHPRWVRSAQGTVSVTATDTGLGVKSATVTHAALTGDATASQTHPCSGDRTDRCPATWNTARPDWTTSWPYDTDEMPEGIQRYGVAVRDIVENRTPADGDDASVVPPSKIDRSTPTGITGTGQIPDLDGHWFLGDDTRTIDVAAHDTYSGVQTIQIETTDGQVLDTKTFDCSGDQCPHDPTAQLAVDTTKLPEGDTTVRVRATDLVGNTDTSRTWTLRIDRSEPTDVIGSGDLVDRDGSYVAGDATVNLSLAAADQYSGVQRFSLLDGSGATIADGSLGCETQCPNTATKDLAFNTASLTEGTHELRGQATDLVDHATDSQAWTVYVDRTGPAFGPPPVLDPDDGNSGGLTPDPASGTSVAEWDPAIDPALADGTPGSGTASYTVRYRATGTDAWSSPQTATETRVSVDLIAPSVDLEIVARDAVGNAGPATIVAVTGFEQDPEPIPSSTPSTGVVYGIPGDTRDEDESGGEVNEEYGAQSRSQASHNPGSRHYTCKDDAYGPVQAWPSGFVFGTCEPGLAVHSFDLATWPKTYDKNHNPTGYPGALSEGWQWAGVALPKQSSFNGCGWMSTAKRLDHTGDDNTPTCAKTSYKLGDFVHSDSTTPDDAPPPENKLHKGYLIWSSIKMKADGKTPDLKNGKVQEINGRPWTSKGTCQTYANINPWKRHQTAHGPIEEDGSPFVIEKGDETTIRYMSRFTAKNPETGHEVFWVLLHTDDKYAPWVWVSAPCLF